MFVRIGHARVNQRYLAEYLRGEVAGTTFELRGEDARLWKDLLDRYTVRTVEPEPEPPPQSWRDRPPML